MPSVLSLCQEIQVFKEEMLVRGISCCLVSLFIGENCLWADAFTQYCPAFSKPWRVNISPRLILDLCITPTLTLAGMSN